MTPLPVGREPEGRRSDPVMVASPRCASQPTPSVPGRPVPSRVAFEPIFREVQWPVAIATLFGVLMRDGGRLMAAISHQGDAAAIAFVVDFTIATVVAAVLNVIVVGLPIAGLIYSLRNRTLRGR
jgi:hypothetical protein